jgi:hypothetical protein
MLIRCNFWMVAVAVLPSGATSSNAEQIVNGGFDVPPLPPGTNFVDMTGNSIEGWTIPDGWSIGLIRDY